MSVLVLGLGVAFLVFGLPLVQRFSGGSAARVQAIYLAVGWLLVSWLAHENLHIHVGENLRALLFIEYGFHTTLQISGLVLAYGFISSLRDGGLETATR